VLLGLAGVLASVRGRPVWLAAGAPYVRHHLKSYDRSARGLARAVLDLPGRSLVDMAGVITTLRAAVRHRAPVA
jgi:hypothetical protein